jgi:hypothetical protein
VTPGDNLSKTVSKSRITEVESEQKLSSSNITKANQNSHKKLIHI